MGVYAAMNKWDVSPGEAVAVQLKLRRAVRMEYEQAPIHLVAGVDVSIDKDSAFAAVVVLTYPALDLVEASTFRQPLTFPYIPGLLSFRELPVILAAWERLRTSPDLVLVDGHGYAHPRRFGIACHLGVELDLPSIGCAKSKLCGVAGELASEYGATSLLYDGEDVIGSLVRTKTGISSVYVSVGHRINLSTAIDLVLKCTRKYRLPEPTRQAHIVSNQARRVWGIGVSPNR
jgi:deoxyribonuclease V